MLKNSLIMDPNGS